MSGSSRSATATWMYCRAVTRPMAQFAAIHCERHRAPWSFQPRVRSKAESAIRKPWRCRSMLAA
ncbi:MAG: hypothetical protein CSB44_01130 [Gammaproteobacteria bacterium]|nr:MAG: hypothetical protein CSB44_01130 [Gammaproteobacteria bacterium]